MKKTLLASLLLLFVGSSYSPRLVATETDNFTGHLIKLKDSLPPLEALTSSRLRKAMDWANSQSTPCSSKNLRTGVWNMLGGNLWGRLETDLERMDIFDKASPTIAQSVYQYFTPIDSIYWAIGVTLGSTIRLGEYRIGTDKFGHFFAEGNALFQKAFLQGQGIENALIYTEETERGVFGSGTTGVYSYGDKVANFNGMIFWSKLTPEFAKNSPFLGEPYFQCQNYRWVQTRKFIWTEIIDGAWDEAINCSAFRNKMVEGKVYRKIGQLEAAFKTYTGKSISLRCPLAPDLCLAAVEKYKGFGPRLIHPDCFNAARDLHNRQNSY
jgi:hypothetical protein